MLETILAGGMSVRQSKQLICKQMAEEGLGTVSVSRFVCVCVCVCMCVCLCVGQCVSSLYVCFFVSLLQIE